MIAKSTAEWIAPNVRKGEELSVRFRLLSDCFRPQATSSERSDHIVGQNSTRGPFQESFRGWARASA